MSGAISDLVQQDVSDITTAVKRLVGFFGYTREDIDRLIDAVFEDIDRLIDAIFEDIEKEDEE